MLLANKRIRITDVCTMVNNRRDLNILKTLHDLHFMEARLL